MYRTSIYYDLEIKRMRDGLKSKVREAVCRGAARMHLRSRSEEENEETIDAMVKDLLATLEENKYKLPDWPELALDIEEFNKQLRNNLASICVIYEDLGYGPYITEQSEAENDQETN